MIIVRDTLFHVFGRVLWMYLSSFFILEGHQLLGMGLLGEINVRTYYESRHKPIYTVRERMG